jgi:hypothetical protein
MAIFNIVITEETQLSGITAARLAYNAALPEKTINDNGEEIPNPNLIDTDNDYLQFVMSRAAESYAKQYGFI